MRKLDTVGWYLATMHQLVGHDKTAQIIGSDPGDRRLCVLCRCEKGLATKADVIDRIGVE